MISSKELYPNVCQKIDPWCVDAYFNLKLDGLDPSTLILENSWGETEIDLTPAVQDAETVTHLNLTDSALQFNREDYGRELAPNGGVDCIGGDALSRIISMQKLKDVNQTVTVGTGDVYMYNESNGVFSPFQLQEFVDSTNEAIKNLQNQIAGFQAQLNALTTLVNNNYTALNNRITNLETLTTRPEGIPQDTVIAWGNRNYYTDFTNTDQRTTGIFTHSTAQTLTNDSKDA